jgi:hypothetical protein
VVGELILSGIVCFENFHAFFQEIVLMILDERSTHAQAFLFRTAGDQADG